MNVDPDFDPIESVWRIRYITIAKGIVQIYEMIVWRVLPVYPDLSDVWIAARPLQWERPDFGTIWRIFSMRGGPASPCCSSGVLRWKPFYSRLPGPGHSSASSLAFWSSSLVYWSSSLVSNQKTFTVWSQDHFLTNWSSHCQKNLKVNQNETERLIAGLLALGNVSY